MRGANTRRRVVRGITIAVALAVAAAFLLMPRSQPPAPAKVASSRPPAALPEPPAAPARVVQVGVLAGQARVTRDGRDGAQLAIDSVLHEGSTIETDATSEAHLWLGATASLLLPPNSRITLLRLREREIEIALERGEVISSVQPLGAGRYAVQASGHRVVVRGTHFSVARAGEALAVQVDKGAVAVMRDEAVVAELRAPQRWTLPAEPKPKAEALRRPHPTTEGAPDWPVLEVPVWPRIVLWEIGGTALPAAQSLRMRVPVGELEIGALLADGRRMRARITVDALGARFDPRELRFAASEAARVRGQRARPERCCCGDSGRAAGACSAATREAFATSPQVRCARGSSSSWMAAARCAEPGCGQTRPCRSCSAHAFATSPGSWRFPAPGGSGITFEAPILFQPR